METDKISEADDLSYFIDFGWFQENDRSFTAVASRCLCSDCRERLISEQEEITPALLMTNIRDCCSKVPGFISPKLPLFEKIFRLFLSEGNKPLRLKELTAQLSSSVDNPASLTPHSLKRLLGNDRYYGFCQILGEHNPS